MKKPATLKLNKEFRRAYYRGKYRAGSLLVTYLVRTGRREVRYGITTGKKIGGAVERNRARRVIRAAFRELYERNGWAECTRGADFVFVAREKTPGSTAAEVAREMERQIRALTEQTEKKDRPQN